MTREGERDRHSAVLCWDRRQREGERERHSTVLCWDRRQGGTRDTHLDTLYSNRTIHFEEDEEEERAIR